MAAKARLDPTTLVARIIAELQSNPDAQRLLLRALLTNEFLGMPARLDRIEQDIAELKVDVAALKADMATLKTDVATLKTDVAYLKGSDLESRLHRKIRSLVSGAFALRRSHIVQSNLKEPDEDFLERVEDALDEGRITAGQENRIESTDFILRAQRRDGRAPVWVAVEASHKVHANDIQRVRATADALHTIFDEDALAVVAGSLIEPPDEKRAKASGVQYLAVAPATPI